MLLEKLEGLTKTYRAQSGVDVCLISLIALAEEPAAVAAQKKMLDEQAIATEVAMLKSHLAQMSNQLVPDGAVLGMSKAGLLASLLVMFDVTEEDLLDHPQFRDMDAIDPVVYPDYTRHVLVTSLYEQGVQFSLTMMGWLRPLSVTATRVYNADTLWGDNPEHDLRIVASRLYYCPRLKRLEFILNAFLRCRLDAVASLPSGHPDIEAARRAVLAEVKMSGIPIEEEQVEEEEPDPEPMTLQQAVAKWTPSPGQNPLSTVAPSRRDRDAQTTRAALEYNVTPFEATDPRELLAKVTRLTQNILTTETELAAGLRFPHKAGAEFYSPNQAKAYNDKMNSCRALETIMQSHSEPSSELREELGRLQYQIAQEAATLWVNAEMGFTAGKKFSQTMEGADDSSYMSVFKEGFGVAKAAQEAERALLAAAALAAAARQPRVSAPRSNGHPYANSAWKTYQDSSPNETWGFGSPGPARKRGSKAGSPAAGGKAGAPAGAGVWCYNCGEAGHKSNVCTQAVAIEDSPATWQPEVQQAIEWRSDWTPGDHSNARPAWPETSWQEGGAKGATQASGKTGGKGKSGAKGFRGYGKSGGASSSFKGGGKGYGWPTGGSDQGASWAKPYS